MTSKVEYAAKYCQSTPKAFVIGFVIVGNPFPVMEHPFMTNEEGKVVMQDNKPKKNENGYLGKPINPGYQSHFTLGILSTFLLIFLNILINNKFKKLMVDLLAQPFQSPKLNN